jgi:hypothetical protein
MNGRQVWVSVDGEPRIGTVKRENYVPKTGTWLLAVELKKAVEDTETVVVNPQTDDIVFESER